MCTHNDQVIARYSGQPATCATNALPILRWRMPLLRVIGDGRLISANVEGVGANILPRFPYQTNIEWMTTTPPDWPERTH